MEVDITCEAIREMYSALLTIEDKVAEQHNKSPEDLFADRNYGLSLRTIIIVMVCYPDSDETTLKPRIRYTKKDLTLGIDIVYPGSEVLKMTKHEILELAARRLLCDPLKVLEKYTRNKKLYDFDFERFRADWREMLIPTGLVGDGDCG